MKASTELEPLKLSRLLLENGFDASFLPSLQVSLTAVCSTASGILGEWLNETIEQKSKLYKREIRLFSAYLNCKIRKVQHKTFQICLAEFLVANGLLITPSKCL